MGRSRLRIGTMLTGMTAGLPRGIICLRAHSHMAVPQASGFTLLSPISAARMIAAEHPVVVARGVSVSGCRKGRELSL